VTREDGHPDAWIYMMHRQLRTNMYDPIIFTLEEALSSNNATVKYASKRNTEELVRSVRASVAAGRRPLVIAVAFYFGPKETLVQCSQLGAYVVLYQTEPIGGRLHYNVKANVARFNASEVWDYSLANVERYNYTLSETSAVVRYMPPGYAEQLQLNVDAYSSKREEGIVAFLGDMRVRGRRLTEFVNGSLKGKFAPRNDVWGKAALAGFLTRYPLQLNLHKIQPMGPSSEEPMEAFRMSQLLTNKACVISTPVHPLDEARWEGIAHFAQPSDLPEAVFHVSKDVRACQSQSYEAFRERFAPSRLLQESGFAQVLQQLLHGQS